MFWNIIWLIFLIYSFMPLFRHRQIEIARFRLIREIEKSEIPG
nr:hypothetical protein [Biomaibacter acetigenes]